MHASPYYRFTSVDDISVPRYVGHILFLMIFAISLISSCLIFTPWTQTAAGTGHVTTLNPSDRTQNITALVKGRIKQWHVHEGDRIKKGDPIVEIIDNDENFVERLTDERDALQYSRNAAGIAANTAKLNYERQKGLFSDGIASKLDVEKAKIEYQKYLSEQQKNQAKLTQSQSKLSRQEAQMIYAPRDGVIISISGGNLATSLKSGDVIAVLVPDNIPAAAALYVNGADIALISSGRKVRLQFEGWPSVQFSGWPSTAIGTFGGVVHAIDPMISSNGKFRILVTPDPDDAPWPNNQYLHYGARAKGWVLLENVRLGYELWRQLNAFPPEYPDRQLTEKSM